MKTIQYAFALFAASVMSQAAMSCQPPPPPPKAWRPPPWTEQVRHEFAWAKVVVLAEVVGVEYKPSPGIFNQPVGDHTVTYRPVSVFKGMPRSAPAKRSFAVSPFMNCHDWHYPGGMNHPYEPRSRVLLFADSAERVRFEVRSSQPREFQDALREVEASSKADAVALARSLSNACTSPTGNQCWENTATMPLYSFTRFCTERAGGDSDASMPRFADRCERPAQGSCGFSPFTEYYYALDERALATVKETCERSKAVWVSHPR